MARKRKPKTPLPVVLINRRQFEAFCKTIPDCDDGRTELVIIPFSLSTDDYTSVRFGGYVGYVVRPK